MYSTHCRRNSVLWLTIIEYEYTEVTSSEVCGSSSLCAVFCFNNVLFLEPFRGTCLCHIYKFIAEWHHLQEKKEKHFFFPTAWQYSTFCNITVVAKWTLGCCFFCFCFLSELWLPGVLVKAVRFKDIMTRADSSVTNFKNSLLIEQINTVWMQYSVSA